MLQALLDEILLIINR